MAILAADVLAAARLVSPAFNERFNPDPVVEDFLTRYVRRIIGRVTMRNPDAFMVDELVTLPFGDFDAGEALPAHHRFYDGWVLWKSAGSAVDRLDHLALTSWDDRIRTRVFPSGSIVNGFFRPHGRPELWERYQSYTLRYVPLHAAVTLASTIVMPDTALDVLVAAVADFMAPRVPLGINPPTLIQNLRQDRTEAERLFIKEIGSSRMAWSDQVADVF